MLPVCAASRGGAGRLRGDPAGVLMRWTCGRFDTLDAPGLYAVLQLRSEVFVVEQACLYRDIDGLDLAVWHLRGFDEAGALQAYARLVPPGLKGEGYPQPMIGRVVTAPTARGAGQGRALMVEALAECARLWPGQAIEIQAQAHLQKFYGSLGFVATSAPYDDDGIDHVDMRREPA